MVHLIQQRLHLGGTVPGRLHHRKTSQILRIPAAAGHCIPVNTENLLRPTRHQRATQKRAGLTRRLSCRTLNLLGREQRAHTATRHQTVIQALRRVNISVLQIQRLQLRIRIIYALSDITAHQRILRHPIQTIRQRERVGFQSIQNLAPQVENLRGRSIHTRRVRLLVRTGCLIVGALNLQGARRTARGHRVRQGRRRRR